MAKKKSMKKNLVSNNRLFETLMKMGCYCRRDEHDKIVLRWLGGFTEDEEILFFPYLSRSHNLGWYNFEFFVPYVIS